MSATLPTFSFPVKGTEPPIKWLLVVPSSDPYAKGRWYQPPEPINCYGGDLVEICEKLNEFAPEGHFVIRFSTKEARPA